MTINTAALPEDGTASRIRFESAYEGSHLACEDNSKTVVQEFPGAPLRLRGGLPIPINTVLDPEIGRLLTDDSSDDETDEAFIQVVDRLRAGDATVLHSLYQSIRFGGWQLSVDSRSLVMQALSNGATIGFQECVVDILAMSLADSDDRIRVSAIAAASNLLPTSRAYLKHSIGLIAQDSFSGPDVRRAAMAFLRYQ